MSVGDELRDPWGWLVAGVSGGVGWAALATALGPVAIPVGLGIGAAVLGTKVAVGARHRNDAQSPVVRRGSGLPKPPRGSAQEQLLQRARRAQDRIATLADGVSDPWLSERIGRVDDEVMVVNERLADLAGRITVADASLQSARPEQLIAEHQRTAAAVAAESDADLRAERERALAAIAEQLAAVKRLATLRETLLSRMQTAALGLEGLGTRMGELVALGSDPVGHDRSAEVLAELTGDLDTVRSGLAEAEALSRQL